MLRFRRVPRARSPASASASLIGLAFAVIAAGLSASGAYMMTEEFGPKVWGVMIALSLAAVYFEKNSLLWIGARRARDDLWGVRFGWFILAIAVLYTAGMQVTTLGSFMLKPGARDMQSAVEAVDAQKRVNDLETKRSWVAQPKASARALEEQLRTARADAVNLALPKRARDDAALQVTQINADLASARSFDELTEQITRARHDLAELQGRPPADIKAAMIGAFFGVKSNAMTYILILLAVLFVQAGQIMLPVIAGKAEIASARAAAAVIDLGPPAPPRAQIETVQPMVIEQKPEGPLAQKAKQAKADARAQQRKQLTHQPKAGGLASKLS